MARTDNRTTRDNPSSSRFDTVRLTIGPFHTVRYLGAHSDGPLFRPLVQKPA
jgi:hypothetical protein